jgi:high-affinity iron transporter
LIRVTWGDSAPNLLIGSREGLEAGLVVSILLAAVRKVGPGAGGTSGGRVSVSIWLGALGAVMLSGSFAAVPSFSTKVLSIRVQEVVGGLLGVLTACLLTVMIFWMRRTASSLSAHLCGKAERVVPIGAAALTITAFLTVSREDPEAIMLLSKTVDAWASIVTPPVGAGIGLAVAVVLCWLLYRKSVQLNVGVFSIWPQRPSS